MSAYRDTLRLNLPFVIFGAGGHSLQILEIVQHLGYSDFVFVDPRTSENEREGYPVVEKVCDLPSPESDASIAVGKSELRLSIYMAAMQEGNFKFPPIIHPSSIISHGVKLAAGAQINAGVIIGPKVDIGEFALLNMGSIVGHESKIGRFSSLAPNSNLAGNVTIGEGATIGLSASIAQGINVGDFAILGANSFLKQSVEMGKTFAGNPAREIS